MKIGIFFALLFSIFTIFVNYDLFSNFDYNATIVLQKIIPRSVDTFFSAFSLIGSVEIAGLFLLLIVYLFKRLNALIVPFMFAALHIPELLSKTYLDHPGPPVEFLRFNLDFIFPSSGVSPGFAYPSGHAARTAFVSIVLFFFISKVRLDKNKKYVIYAIIILFDAVMLISRVYLGEHWTSDVVGGSLLGAAFAVLSLAFL